MNFIEREIENIFDPRGKLANGLEGFEVRPSQVEMAQLIAKALEKEIFAIIEAGTGTGKTFGYLVPIVLSGKKAIISTGTKNLQDQIFHKDIPFLCDALRLDVDVVMMKGRRNYLCLYKYHQLTLQPSLLEGVDQELIQKLDSWIQHTEFADCAELSWLKEDDPLWESLSCPSEHCLGCECMFYEECFLNKLKRRAAEARIIIVNHHLFFADLKVRKTGFAEIIPRSQVVLFDEAHNLEEIACTYFGETLSTRQLTEFASDAEKESTLLDKKAQISLKKALDNLRAGAEQLKIAFYGQQQRGPVDAKLLSFIRETIGHNILNALLTARAYLEEYKRESIAFPGLAARAQSLADKIDEILKTRDENWLLWFEQRKKSLAIHLSPLDISQQMKENLFNQIKTVIFTSATISTNGTFDYISSRLGLDKEKLEAIYPSHFDFSDQALMYIPKDLPLPSDAKFSLTAAHRISKILQRTLGRALVLFTSHHNMNIVFKELQGTLPFVMLKQGDAPSSELLEEFRRDVHSVLFATGAFWQGIDVPEVKIHF